jgi:hypothetical protein
MFKSVRIDLFPGPLKKEPADYKKMKIPGAG